MPYLHKRLTSVSRSMTLALLLALTACSGDDDDTQPAVADTGRGTTTTTTSAADGGESERAAVLAAYREFWSVFDAYAAEEAPFDADDFQARFSPVATGGEYDHLYERFQLDRLRGWVTRGGESDVYRPEIVELAEGRAVVEDCADDTGGIFATKEGTWIEPETPGARSFLRVVLVQGDDGRWRVTSVGGEDTECAA